ncbi:MAG: transcription antitermination factor NusB [Mycoplasmatales bacterium]
MEKKRHGKSIAREAAVKSIYTYSITGSEKNIFSSDKMGNEIAKNTLLHIVEIDAIIQPHLRRWTMSELNQVNLAILRISTYEILFEDTPKQIIVNEALELTKLYSDVAAKNFVHSVLDNIIKD